MPLPRKITRLKLLGLYTKHVGMITAGEVDPKLTLTPASALNARSLCFSIPAEPNDPQTYVFQKGIPDPRFYYSVATVSQLQAELLRHGFGTRTRERRSVLVAMYKKEVLKIELEPGTDCTLLNAHATKHTSTSKEEFGREELVPPGIAASVYYKLSVMELRKILEPHPCVVRLLHKQDLVALCDKFKPAFGKSQALCVETPIWKIVGLSYNMIYVYDGRVHVRHKPDTRGNVDDVKRGYEQTVK